VDGLTWQDYEADLDHNIEDLHARVHRGAYRAMPSRRQYLTTLVKNIHGRVLGSEVYQAYDIA
jgi:hypothetical protein